MSALTRACLMILTVAIAAAAPDASAQEAAADFVPSEAITLAQAPTAKPASETPPDPAEKSTERTSAKTPTSTKSEQPGSAAKTPPKKTPAVKLVVGEPPAPDDYALRYYASQRQMARVNAELLRLKRLYPDYEPPRDLYEKPGSGGADEEELWRLFSADKVDEMRAYIAQKQRATPDWKPSADLSKKMRHKELRLKIGAFFKAEKFLDLVDYVKGENVDLGELSEDIDVVWTIAEAFARAKQHEEAVATFKRVLTTSKDPHIRRATVQKAMAAMRMADVETLLAAVEGGSDVTGDFAPLLIDITRARIAAWLHDERAHRPTPEEIEKFEGYARDSRDANQIGLVAWYYFKRRETERAFEWFKLAIEKDGDATIAHGLAHTLQRLGRAREAEEVSYAWRETLANNVILYLDILGGDLMREVPPYIEPARLARYAQATMEVASGEGAQALGWYAYSSCQFDVALAWFERAAAWRPRESAVIGYALTLRKLKKEKDFIEAANRYDGLFAKIVEPLFPDDYYRPPTPCDEKRPERYHGAALRTTIYTVPGPALIPGAAANYDPAYVAQKSAPIDLQTPIDVQLARIMKNLKSKFPIVVNVENPLRYRAPTISVALTQRASAASIASAIATPLGAEPSREAPPLVARRVPGVGSMPYERFGFSLLPGWNGIETATWPPYTEQPPLKGTPAAEAADPTKAGIAVFDQRNPANARGLPPGGTLVAPYRGAGPPPSVSLTPPVYATPAPSTPSSNNPVAAWPRPAYGQYPTPVSR